MINIFVFITIIITITRMAVEEWISSKYKVHILRDHINHCIVMNGGKCTSDRYLFIDI